MPGTVIFGALLWAKLRWLNVKPADPASLNFVQRIMWDTGTEFSDLEVDISIIPCNLVRIDTGSSDFC